MRNRIILLAWILAVTSVGVESGKSETVVYEESPLNAGLDLQYVPIRYDHYDWHEGATSDRVGHGLHLALEWLPIPSDYGKLGVGVGVGVNYFKEIPVGDRRITLTTVPLDAFLSYRLDYFYEQLAVPFVKLGASWTPPTKEYYGLDYGGGLAFRLNGIDKVSARSLDSTIGINTTYFVVEFIRSRALKKPMKANLEHDEFRIGLRFEM